ncbi:hypothetical protein BV25DRAFT_1821825 [Artomyces pyxidatus]|uniref:Uncharacterized protein n=1 Tax=Artomyces pyxidatus TaxID=48021 RepID=A0ACB8TBA1_9AGAM|nr:hypothetical protein BV25DRAFT_1821825 [Artomyces pyxidatus]
MASPPFVPYQAYKSKRHSRSLSNQKLSITPEPSPPRPAHAQASESLPVPLRLSLDLPEEHDTGSSQRPVSADMVPQIRFPPASPSPSEPASPASARDTHFPSPKPPNGGLSFVANAEPSLPSSSKDAAPLPKPTPLPTRRTSTFRHVPSRNTSVPSSPSPLRPDSHLRTSSIASRQFDLAKPKAEPRSRLSSTAVARTPSGESQPQSNGSSRFSTPSTSPQPPQKEAPHIQIQRASSGASDIPRRVDSMTQPPIPPLKTSSPTITPANLTPVTSPSASTPNTRSGTPVRSPAPYRPGFQPKGVYRQLTDEFLEARRTRRDIGRIENTRLERRLEKLINLHFGKDAEKRATVRPRQVKRMSSIFELDIRNMAPGDLWRGVVTGPATPGSKSDIRAAEQSITPWENDANVSHCPLCSASFHPITNRKHHCRLCGKIICSLPVKHPQRPATCSLLFVADPKTGQIEEVGEGVDYGVRRKSTLGTPGTSKEQVPSPEEKFLKGVRICRDCRPVLLRQQYTHDVAQAPTFARLYDVFVSLEKEIEDSLPLFQELLMSLSTEDRPTAEASAARKRILEAFAQYDALAKRIRKLPAPAGSSQDRVQAAVLMRANVFLQKHMFPLQSLPKPQKASSSPSPVQTPGAPDIDPDSEVAHALQPLLEQEALLESFVEEANAHRKFEDAKTLKGNLQEIRAEIDKILANAHGDGLMRQEKHRSD